MHEASQVLFSLTIASVAILLLTAVVLCLHDRFSGTVWVWLVSRANGIEVEYLAAGLGLVSTGLNLFEPKWVFVGVILVLAGAVLIGIGIGNSFGILKRHLVRDRGDRKGRRGKMKTAVIYCRISTNDQGREGTSLGDQ